MPITAMPNGLSVKLIFFAFLNVDLHGTVSFLNDTTGCTYIFTTKYMCRYMRKNFAPLGGCFNSNRNRRIVELSCFRNSYLLIFVHQITLTQGEQLSDFSFPW